MTEQFNLEAAIQEKLKCRYKRIPTNSNSFLNNQKLKTDQFMHQQTSEGKKNPRIFM